MKFPILGIMMILLLIQVFYNVAIPIHFFQLFFIEYTWCLFQRFLITLVKYNLLLKLYLASILLVFLTNLLYIIFSFISFLEFILFSIFMYIDTKKSIIKMQNPWSAQKHLTLDNLCTKNHIKIKDFK